MHVKQNETIPNHPFNSNETTSEHYMGSKLIGTIVQSIQIWI